MNRTILTVMAVVLAIPAFCQKAKFQNEPFAHRTSIQGELFGHGLFYSVNLEQVIWNKPKIKTTIQAGYAGYPGDVFIPNWIPVTINEIFSFGKHHAEFGLGPIFTTEMGHDIEGEEERQWDVFWGFRLGYRYQKTDGHWIYRIGFTPILDNFDFRDLHPSGTIAIGYCF